MSDWMAPSQYGLGWLYDHQPPTPEMAEALAVERAAALTEREAALRRMEASDSQLLRDMAKALGGSSKGPSCEHGIDKSAGCGRCMESDEQMGAAMSARFEHTS